MWVIAKNPKDSGMVIHDEKSQTNRRRVAFGSPLNNFLLSRSAGAAFFLPLD